MTSRKEGFLNSPAARNGGRFVNNKMGFKTMLTKKLIRQFISITMCCNILMLTGCASIFGKSQYPVEFSSAPNGANFSVENKKGRVVHEGITPSTLVLPSSNGYFSAEKYTVKYTKDGYDSHTNVMNASLSGWYWGNILFGFVGLIIGSTITDPLTGAMYKLPEIDNAALTKSK